MCSKPFLSTLIFAIRKCSFIARLDQVLGKELAY